MTDSIIERQAIRAALALAVASAHGQAADAIADMRDEAVQLIGLCIKSSDETDVIRLWCDDASALIERLSSDGYLPRRSALSAAAAVLRLRLAVARKSVSADRDDAPAQKPKKKIASPATKPPVSVVGNQKVVMDYVSEHPEIRTKDLIDALKKSLSPRTVKRCLKELCDADALHRTRQDDRSVSYRVDSQV
ncbi:MAG: BlaI/MecI/CopY family transcriptional regulator [Patescibacteria group bacterium]